MIPKLITNHVIHNSLIQNYLFYFSFKVARFIKIDPLMCNMDTDSTGTLVQIDTVNPEYQIKLKLSVYLSAISTECVSCLTDFIFSGL